MQLDDTTLYTAPWLSDLDDETSRFLEDFNILLDRICSDHVSALESSDYVPSSKSIQDNLWGFIRFSAPEIALIDSPVLQRLRRIRQLGLAHLLFPSAGYSRFEHTLGVCHVIELLRISLEDHFSTKDYTTLRIAALFHDTGHGPLSHVAERAWCRIPHIHKPLTAIRQAIRRRWHTRETPSLAEVLSVCICVSPIICKTISLAFTTAGGLPCRLHDLIDATAQHIIGAVPNPANAFVSELLCGDIDADKFDYIARDCLATGVPLPFDVKRLIHKLRVADHYSTHDHRKRLAVSASGARAVMDLTISRTLMRQKIYRHPKVMVAEACAEAAIVLAAQASPRTLHTHDVLFMTDEILCERISRSLDKRTTDTEVVIRLLDMTTNRFSLPKRAFALSTLFLLDHARLHPLSADNDSALDDRLDYCTMLLKDTKQLRDEIFTELANILQLLGKSHLCPLSAEFLFVESAAPTSGAGGPQLPPLIVDHAGQLVPDHTTIRSFFWNPEWANAYEAANTLTYIFCPEAIRVYCHVATRNVLAQRGLLFSPLRKVLCNITDHDVIRVDQEILQASRKDVALTIRYRDILLFSLQADHSESDAYLQYLTFTGVEVFEDVNELIDRRSNDVESWLRSVAPFVGLKGDRLTRLRLAVWVAQFPQSQRDSALELALQVRLVNRDSFVDTARLAATETNVHSLLVTSLTDSGASASYYSRDLNDADEGLAVDTSPNMQSAILRFTNNDVPPNTTLLVLDDILGMGKQFTSTLHCWFGKPHQAATSKGTPLDQQDIRWLRDNAEKVVWGFGFGLDEGVTVASNLLEELGLSAARVVRAARSSVPEGVFGPDSQFLPEARRRALRDTCERIGVELLKDRAAQRGWSKKRLLRNAVGYSGASQTVATASNIPTISVTALWGAGQVDGQPWEPLIRRRYRQTFI